LPDRPLKVLLLADDKPGHYHQSEGVVAALRRLRSIEVQRLTLRRRVWLPTRVLRRLVNLGAAPHLILGLGYGVAAGDLAPADHVVSAGGETLAANAAAAKLLAAPNVFCGTLRRLAPEHFQVVIVPQEDLASSHPNYLLALPPSPFEIPRKEHLAISPDAPPSRVGLLVGGNSGSVTYTDRDWETLLAFLGETHRHHGIRWLVTTSRRSDTALADALAALAAQANGPIERFVDYRFAGPGTLAEILARVQAVLVTADSTAMITQSVCACLPVVTVASEARRMEERELEYRAYLTRRGWLRALPFSQLSPEAFLDALAEVTPRKTGALDDLAAALAQRLSGLLAPSAPTDRVT
jgi:mitochondrial fission protein ELM1